MIRRFLATQFARPQGAAGRFLVSPLLDWTGKPMMGAAFDALDPRAGEAILDLGVGGGALSRRLAGAGVVVTGVDPSDVVVARARRRIGGEARFLQGRGEEIPLPDRCVDKAASVNTVYFWPALAPVMAELARVLRPGGRLVLGFQTAAAVRAWPGHVHGFRAWEDAAIAQAVEAAGFAIREIRPGHSARVGDYRTLIALGD
jgi:SAM-dependent methyltransferase